MSDAPVLVCAPRDGGSDDVMRVVGQLVADGAEVAVGTPLVALKSAKSAIELEATAVGFAFHLVPAGTEVRVGMPVVAIAQRPTRPHIEPAPAAQPSDIGPPADVEACNRKTPGEGLRAFRGEVLASDVHWDALRDIDLHRELRELLTRLRRRMKAKYDRHVPTGELLYDRWELAKDYGFGEGTSVYDSCLIIGPVTVGRHCWIGPSTILDGQGGLTIGDYVDVSAGVHIYSHNTINRALTGHRAPLFKKATTIGNCCFIGPYSIIAPGAVIRDHSFVAAGSYVAGVFPANSYIAGNPARRMGTIIIEGERVRIRSVKPS